MRETQHKPSDVDLVRSACEGDHDAYGTLVDRHLKAVYAVALRILGHRADAEDVAQDAFLRAYERLDTFDQTRSFRNWLLKIASNLSINRIRSLGRERRLRLRVAEADGESGSDGTTARDDTEGDDVPSPREWAYWLDQIDETQRAAIVLFHFHELPYKDIAEVLNVPVNTVRTYLYRGRKRLRSLMTAARGSENGAWTVAM